MKVDRYTATIIAVAAAMGLLLTKTHTVTGAAIPVWRAIWPVFGTGAAHGVASLGSAHGLHHALDKADLALAQAVLLVELPINASNGL